MVSRSIWTLPINRFFHHRFDDDRHLLFDKLSGRTHLLNSLCMDALDILNQSDLNSGDLIKVLAENNSISLDEEWIEYINAMLVDLDNQGLIEPYVL